ncbi:MAG TPA: molybdopterin-dependent oxidoreductase [Bryobacterales bacterium]|nr:molybdopterin-dependent oxidoreductase [Bryobacterales bacterium]
MDRRDFFKIVSTASTGLVTGACGKKIDRYIPLLVSEREAVPGEEQWHPGVCGECAAGCGVIARVMEGERIIEQEGQQFRQRVAAIKKIEGNPLDPVSGGRLCARGQAALQGLYNPDRLQGPMRRKGPKGDADFALMSWQEAIAVAAEKLDRARKNDPTQILFIAGPQPGTRALAIARFLEAIGAPPAVTFEPADFPLERKAAEQVHGWSGLPVYDLARARYALGIGADFLGGWASPVFYSRRFGNFRQGRPGVRGKLVQAESRFSTTAHSADEWLPLRPGTELLFALALGRLLLDQNLARQPGAVAGAVLQAYQAADPGAAARACGIDEKRLRRVARELGESEAPLVIPGASVSQTNSLAALIAAGSLNLLLGNVQQPGGVQGPAPEPTASRPAFANPLAALERARFLFVDSSNPLYTLPAALGVAEKLARVDEMVSFSPFLNDTAAYADLLLPDHHTLETTAAIVPAVAPGPEVLLATPFVQPLYETRATEQVLADLAKAVKVSFEAATPRSVAEPLLPEGLAWEDVVRQGGIWSAAAAAPGPANRPPARKAAPAAAALDLTPAEFAGDAAEFPLHFQPYLSLQFGDGRSANLPWMQELPDPASSAMWGLPVEVDPKTAAKLGISTGDLVRVESRHGKLEAPAYVHPAAIPGVVSMAIGQGHRHFGRYASNRGANPLAILAPQWEKTTGALALGATRVRLARLGPRGGLTQFSPQDREMGPWGYR